MPTSLKPTWGRGGACCPSADVRTLMLQLCTKPPEMPALPLPMQLAMIHALQLRYGANTAHISGPRRIVIERLSRL